MLQQLHYNHKTKTFYLLSHPHQHLLGPIDAEAALIFITSVVVLNNNKKNITVTAHCLCAGYRQSADPTTDSLVWISVTTEHSQPFIWPLQTST